ncbi:hypothetical protein [Rhizobium paknamense]|uniref:Uncharacterized protein n=1 Tax=Rhizobium paknamense TaxID=1206817 RepID=A0ABU0I8S5_9HYPH|nr:hypothetical protein [Rhizobium paknamense]MDQ0454636.1 hypothetical protein [Rhizobium paknamense]
MKISLKRKIAMTAVLAGIYLGVSIVSGFIVGNGLLHVVAGALLAIPFGWLIRETWSDD